MNLWHLQVFREVMLAGSVTKAAANLGRTQPAISTALANLEREIGYALFERKNSRLQPVPEAQYLLGEAEEILGRMSSLERSLREGGGRDGSQIRIVCMPILAEFFMPDVVGRFVQDNPRARFLVVSTSSLDVQDRISAQQFDVGLAEQTYETDLVHAEPFEVDCVCALPAGDPLASKPYVTPKDLDGRPCATLLPEHFIPRRLRETFADAGARLNAQFELQNAAAQYPLITSKRAFGVFSPISAWIYRTAHQEPDAIAFVPLRPAVRYPFAILTPAHRPLSRLARAFVDRLRDDVATVLAEMEAAHPGVTGDAPETAA